jgi:hypothetical protein
MFEQLAAPIADFIGAKQTQRWEKQAARTQMDFQERMSNTAYQRAMEDMRLAGINPIMVAKLGGASTPTGAKASSPDLGKIGTNAVQASNAMSQARLARANADLATQDFDTLKARGLSKSILAGNPLNLLINGAMNTLSKADQEKAIKGLLELVGVKLGHASVTTGKNKADHSKDIYQTIKSFIPKITNKKSYKSRYDHPSQRPGREYKKQYDHPSQRGRK